MSAQPYLEKFAAAGLAIVQIAMVNASGIAVADGALTNGNGGGMLRYRGASEANIEAPDPVRHDVIGDSGLSKWTFQFAPEGNPTFNLTQKMMDLVLRARITGTKVQEIGTLQMGVMATDQDGNEPQICALISEYGLSGHDDYWGTDLWVHQLLPLVKMSSKPFAMSAGAQESDMVYAGIVNQSSKTPWGKALTNADNGCTKAAVLPLTSDGPITMDTYLGDGEVGQTYTLKYKPAGDETSGRVNAFDAADGSTVTLADVDVDTGVIDFDSDPDAGAVIVILYEVATGELP